MRSWIVCGLCLSLVSGYSENDIFQFSLPVEPTTSPTSVCAQWPDLPASQRSMCLRYPIATASAVQGIHLGIHECRRVLRDQRWNCTGFEALSSYNPILSKGFKETAFTYAIASAGIVHQVATACSMGKVSHCGCENSHMTGDGKKSGRGQQKARSASAAFQYNGCRTNLLYGSKFARRFMQTKGKDILSLLQEHNSKVGRKAVIERVSEKCKCHGMSTSCTVKTCWPAAPDFEVVSNNLKNLYLRAIKVDRSNSIKGEVIAATQEHSDPKVTRRKYLKKNLIYYERSPTFCDNDERLGVPGTRGRVCNTTSSGMDGCRALCCGRGFDTVNVRTIEKCRCTFHWCCYVRCEKCVREDWVTVCK